MIFCECESEPSDQVRPAARIGTQLQYSDDNRCYKSPFGLWSKTIVIFVLMLHSAHATKSYEHPEGEQISDRYEF